MRPWEFIQKQVREEKRGEAAEYAAEDDPEKKRHNLV
jgi:hypothetical protein